MVSQGGEEAKAVLRIMFMVVTVLTGPDFTECANRSRVGAKAWSQE